MSLLHTLMGGQTWAHRIRMLRHVIKIAILTSLFVGCVAFCIIIMQIPGIYYQGAYYNLKVSLAEEFFERIEVDQNFWHRVVQE